MVDVAALGISIKSGDVVDATQRLDRLKVSADGVTKSTGLIRTAFNQFKSSFSSGFWGEFERGAARSANNVSVLDRSMGAASKTAGLFGGLLKGALAGVSIGATAAAFKSLINDIDETAKTAQKVGLSATEFSKLAYAAKISDVEVGSLETALSGLNDRLADIGAGRANEASRALKAMGISARDANGDLKSSEAILLAVADKFATYRDGAEKSAIASALFGRSGREMIPMLNQGSAAMQELGERATVLGVVISEGAAREADEFNDRLTDLGQYLQGVARTIISDALPTINDLSSALFDTLPNTQNLADAIGGPLKSALIEVSAFALETAQTFRALGTIAGALKDVFNKDFGLTEDGQKIWSDAMAKIKADAASTREEIERLYSVSSGKGDLPVASATRPANDNRPSAPIYNFASPKKPKKPKIDPDIAEAKRIYESVLTPMEAYKKKQADLGRLLKEGHITQTTYNRAVGDAQAEYVKAEGALKTLAVTEQDRLKNIDYYKSILEGARDITQGFFETIRSGIQDGKGLWASFKDAAFNAIKSISQKLLSSGIDRFFNGQAASGPHPLYGGGGGFLSGIFGKLFQGFFADGGNYSANKAMIVGERGPELMVPKSAGKVIPNGGLGGMQEVHIVLHPTEELWAQVDQRDQAAASTAVRVSIAESAKQSKASFGANMNEYQKRKAG